MYLTKLTEPELRPILIKLSSAEIRTVASQLGDTPLLVAKLEEWLPKILGGSANGALKAAIDTSVKRIFGETHELPTLEEFAHDVFKEIAQEYIELFLEPFVHPEHAPQAPDEGEATVIRASTTHGPPSPAEPAT